MESSQDKKNKSTAKKLGADASQALSVSQLNQWIKNTLDRNLYPIWLEAELSDLAQPSSGHLYMTLRDAESQIRGVMWRSSAAKLPFRLQDGLSVHCFGTLDVYAPRGTYQFVIQKMQPKGLGPLQLAFQQLHAKLSREGLFAPERKKPLPRFPKRVAFVTSPSGAAIHDFLEVLRRRWKGIDVLIIPAKVQGEGAAEEIARGIHVAARIRPALDLVVVGRGGGSLEDLWAFNEEVVVRAVAECPLPTVSAVGHEIDVTLCDLAADVRALTPTEAAERILPDSEELLELLQRTENHLHRIALHQLQTLQRRLSQLTTRPVLARPEENLRRLSQRIDELQLRLDRSLDHKIELSQQAIARWALALEALSPLKVLHRGYSMTRDPESQKIITQAKQVRRGDRMETLFEFGSIQSIVESIDPQFRLDAPPPSKP